MISSRDVGLAQISSRSYLVSLCACRHEARMVMMENNAMQALGLGNSYASSSKDARRISWRLGTNKKIAIETKHYRFNVM